MSFWYVATPYSIFNGGHENAFIAAAEQTGLLVRAGLVVFSPIVHSHPLVKHGGVEGTDFQAWQRYDKAMIALSQGVIVCRLPLWEKSSGIKAEIEICRNLGKPVVYMTPGDVPDLDGAGA